MADLATLEQRLEELQELADSGETSLSQDGNSVTFRSMAELRDAIRDLERRIEKAKGTGRHRARRFVTRSGW